MNNYLFNHKKTGDFTHTRIGDKVLNIFGGSYTITNNNEFLKIYYEDIFLNNKNEYLTERQLENGTIAIDFDFRYCHDIKTRQHTKDDIINFVIGITEPLKKYYNFNNQSSFDVFVMEKPNVNVLEDGSLTKDGIHFIIGLNMHKDIKKDYRKVLLKTDFDINLPLINTWDNVIDEGVFNCSNNWMVFGSKKPSNEKYDLTHHFTFGFDSSDKEFTMTENIVPEKIDFELFKKLSVRNIDRPQIELIQQKETKIKQTKSKKVIEEAITDNESDNEELSKFQELLFMIHIDKKDRTTWMRICSCIKYNKMTNKDWLKFCEINNLNMDSEKLDLYEKLNAYPIEIHYLQSLAKKSNPNKYKLWLEKWNIYFINTDDLDDPYKTAVTISNTLKDTLILCKENWYMLTENQLWKQQKEPSFYIINELRKYIDESNKKLVHKISQTEGEQKEKLIEKSKIYLKSYKTISGSSYLNVLTKYLKTLLVDDNFIDKLDKKQYCIAFQNGIYDLKTLTFTEGLNQYDYLTQTIDFNWEEPNENDIEIVKENIKKITNYNDKHLDYYLSALGYALTGDSQKEQAFWYFRGQTAENGKSVIFEALEKIMPCYVCKSTPDSYDKGADNKKEVPTWIGKRIVWVNELSRKQKDEDLLKAIGDGTTYKYKRNYATTSETINIDFKLFCVSNNSLSINADAGIIRRFRLGQFESQFKDEFIIDDKVNLKFIKDKSFGNKLSGIYKFALLKLLFVSSNDYFKEEKLKPYPDDWKKEADENMSDNNKFQTWFKENFNLGMNLKMSKESFEIKLPNEFKTLNIKDELKKIKIPFEYKSQERCNSSKKGTWYGFELIQETEE